MLSKLMCNECEVLTQQLLLEVEELRAAQAQQLLEVQRQQHDLWQRLHAGAAAAAAAAAAVHPASSVQRDEQPEQPQQQQLQQHQQMRTWSRS